VDKTARLESERDHVMISINVTEALAPARTSCVRPRRMGAHATGRFIMWYRRYLISATNPLKRTASPLLAAIVGLVLVCSVEAQQPPAALPVDPTNTILDAFKTHDVVTLGEGEHGNEQGFAFRLALLRDPRFPAVVNDIIVETGNALYQDVMDRFVAGQDVPAESVRRVWQNTTQPFMTFDIPIYEQFFRAVRDVNKSLPRDGQIRVLLGDPPIDWSQVRTREDIQTWLAQRDTYPADLIQREVIAKHRHALVIYGDMHFSAREYDVQLRGQSRRSHHRRIARTRDTTCEGIFDLDQHLGRHGDDGA
jgi:hypothetical protein